MNALASNELIKKAVLTVRKAGKTQQEFFHITIEKGRVTSSDLQAPDPNGGAEMLESVSFSFQKIEVEYRPQGEDGQLRGGMLFSRELYES
jgi:type VI secretion system secreted protein Hcp